jgi:hypothetical protein
VSYVLAAYAIVIGALGAYALHLRRELRSLGEHGPQNLVDKGPRGEV